MSAAPTPPPDASADVEISVELARSLVEEQHPDLLGPVRALSSGWDNDVFRLGPDHLIRLPRRALALHGHHLETTWLPTLELSVPVPRPVRVGRPSLGYPYPWTLTPFLRGRTAHKPAHYDAEAMAEQLVTLFGELHRPAPEGAPLKAARSMPLRQRDEAVRGWLTAIGASPAMTALWASTLAVPGWNGPPVWVHGDLHPYNVVTDGRDLCGVLDWGDLFAGDPAPDLAAVWMLLPVEHHARIRDTVDADTWRRGMGWAVYFGAVLSDVARRGAGAGFGAIGRRTLASLARHGAAE
jgi:aminoglycoside phosphotransferase (APT) family kinase protein